MAVAEGHVFISYVREDSDVVDRLQQPLEAAGIPVWRDITHLGLGLDWRATIRAAITDGALAFLACFSDVALRRERTEQRTELHLAVDEYRRRQPDRPWLIPVRLSDCPLPDYDLGAGRSLASLQWVDLFDPHWDSGLARLTDNLRRLLPLAVEPVRFTTHTATFSRSPVLRYFLNVTSEADRPISITHAWYEDEGHRIPVAPKSRPLPQLLHPGETWSTWIEVDQIPPVARGDAFTSFRIGLADDTVVASTRRTTVPPRGSVPGGPILDDDVLLTQPELSAPPVTGTPGPTFRQDAYQRFWQRYLAEVRRRHPDWPRAAKAPTVGYMEQSCGLRSCHIAPAFKNDGRLGHELVVMDAGVYDWLHRQRSSFEEHYGRPLTWDLRLGRKRCLIAEYRTGSVDVTADHGEYVDWLIDCGERLRWAIATMDFSAP